MGTQVILSVEILMMERVLREVESEITSDAFGEHQGATD